MNRTALIDGRQVSFRAEVGESPVLVCVHGASENHHLYDWLIEALPGRAVVAVDLPGRLGSDGPPLTSVSALASFLERFVESQIGDDHLVMGHSMGGAVAIEYALSTNSATLRGLVLSNTGARLRVHPDILERFERAALERRSVPATEEDFGPDVDQGLIAEVNDFRLLTPPEVAASDWRIVDVFDRTSDVSKIRIPTLILAGGDDRLTPTKYARYLADEIPEAELHLVEGCGHMLLVERPEDIAVRVRWFLRRVGR